jgi:SAM-dependent methyltransferase
MDFYEIVLGRLVRAHTMSTTDSIVVICGGSYDAQCLQRASFTNVIITNVDEAYGCAPFEWQHQDAENLRFQDSSFDWAIVHAGLHHCASPHRGLLEMCRVARKGVVVMEARDSMLIRLAARVGLVPNYELETVAIANFAIGGLRNSAIPNYIYRWTEREVFKTIESAFPGRANKIQFFYGMTLPTQRLSMSTASKRFLARALGLCARAAQVLFTKQCNRFAFVVTPNGNKPWIENDALSKDYPLGFDPNRYIRGRPSAPS